MIDLSNVQNLVARWWYDYDQGNFDAWPDCFTADVHFSCRSDSGQTPFEDFIRADLDGRDTVVAWHVEHRRNSPYPLRHNGTNVHVTESRADEVDFRSYIFVTHVVGGAVSNLSTGLCLGTVRDDGGTARFSDLRVILDFTDSETFDAAERLAV